MTGAEELAEVVVPVHVALHVAADVGQRSHVAVVLADDVDDAIDRGGVVRLTGGHPHLERLRLADGHQLDRSHQDPTAGARLLEQRAEDEAGRRDGEQRTDGQGSQPGADDHLASRQCGHRHRTLVSRPPATIAKTKAKNTAVTPAAAPTIMASPRSPARHIGPMRRMTTRQPPTMRQTMLKINSE